jgi:hypothetical protein
LRDRGGLLERRHVAGLVDHLDACVGDQRLEFIGLNRGVSASCLPHIIKVGAATR